MANDNRRNVPLLDLSCLRSFVAVGQLGSISAAASVVHLSQSAISLQMQRLEAMLGHPLLSRSPRGVRLTMPGEKLLPHARRILDANRMAVTELLDIAGMPPIRLGVPHDVLHPHVPVAMRRFYEAHPAHDVVLETASSSDLCDRMACGELDLIVTTDFDIPEGVRTVGRRKVGWVVARGSELATRRPLPLAFTKGCVFRTKSVSMLEDAGVRFVFMTDSSNVRVVEAAVAADQGVHAMIVEDLPPQLEVVGPDAGLPTLPDVRVNLRVSDPADPRVAAFADELEFAFADRTLA